MSRWLAPTILAGSSPYRRNLRELLVRLNICAGGCLNETSECTDRLMRPIVALESIAERIGQLLTEWRNQTDDLCPVLNRAAWRSLRTEGDFRRSRNTLASKGFQT